MKNLGRSVVLVVGLLVLAGTCLNAAGLAKSGYLNRTITKKNDGASSFETLKIYWEADRMRIEQCTVDGLLIRIKDGDTIYTYSPADKVAIKLKVPKQYSQSVQTMLEEITGPIKGGKKVGSAKVAGIKCDVLSITSKGHSAKVYMSRDPRLIVPLKVVLTSGARSEVADTKAIKLNYNVPDTMFALPKGTTVKEQKLPELPKGQAPAPGK